jgi:hypothetical protein
MSQQKAFGAIDEAIGKADLSVPKPSPDYLLMRVRATREGPPYSRGSAPRPDSSSAQSEPGTLR